MFEDTKPADLDATGDSPDPWAEFRVSHAQERLSLLRELRDGNVPVLLNAPDGTALQTTLWAVDAAQARLNFSAEAMPSLSRLVEADEATAVAYLQSVKLQFDVHGFVLVHGSNSLALHSAMPAEIYRFQRRSAYRVRTPARHTPVARLRHPALPDMRLSLRVLDMSIGGCALWLPHDVPGLQAGTQISDVALELDTDTRFSAGLSLQHVSSQGQAAEGSQAGVRLGCEWRPLPPGAERVLQRWIDRTQQRRRLLSLE